MQEPIYVSVDVETDGPIPGENSLMSIGAAAYDVHIPNPYQPIQTFEATLLPLPNAKPDRDTLAWWKAPERAEAYAAATHNARPPEVVIRDFTQWLKGLPRKPVFVGYPAGFDFTFVHWYNEKFAPPDPFGFSGIDLKTMAMIAMKVPYPEATKKNMPKDWFKDPYGKAPRHTHKALDDALGQGILFLRLRAALNLGERAHRGLEVY